MKIINIKCLRQSINNFENIDELFIKPDINLSTTSYVVKDSIIMPITLIKNIGIIRLQCNNKHRRNRNNQQNIQNYRNQ